MKNNSDDKKRFKPLMTDEDAEAAMSEDLTEYDLSAFKPMNFHLRSKDKQLNLRISEQQLEALKSVAEREGIPYTRLARHMIEQGLKHLTP